ncbi:sm-like protein LSM1B [Humulus lupulus]|uniref:sm-like protein LSM1B n=1 Tax=Humulus lupulus TaxID=3486 RepID=UPI002B40D5AF|nr:sm-like protein LSM1B [Humulus lupulus]
MPFGFLYKPHGKHLNAGKMVVRPKEASEILNELDVKRISEVELYLVLPEATFGLEWKEDPTAVPHIPDPPPKILRRCVIDDMYSYDSIVFLLAEKLLVLLRDGRKLLGLLRSFDQFANVILEGACERAIVGDLYCDIPLGLYVIRGENVVLIGELDLDREELPPHMTRVSVEEIKRAQKAEKDASDLKGTMRKRMEFLDFD